MNSSSFRPLFSSHLIINDEKCLMISVHISGMDLHEGFSCDVNPFTESGHRMLHIINSLIKKCTFSLVEYSNFLSLSKYS